MKVDEQLKTKKNREMKNTEKTNSKKNIKNFEMNNYKFYWIFEGNGNFTQKHDEIDYRRFIERNYESKSNQNF